MKKFAGIMSFLLLVILVALAHQVIQVGKLLKILSLRVIMFNFS